MRYFWLTLKHKWFVFVAGRKLGVPLWRLIKHDWTKFTPSEYPHYQKQFFGEGEAPGFAAAWLHHQNHNDHHWEYWVPRTGHSKGSSEDGAPLPMPEPAYREMIADWMAASRAYEDGWPKAGEWKWLRDNYYKLNLHEDTEIKVTTILWTLGYLDNYGKVKWEEDQ